jgi:multiple sugar transport system ATP-binding protein
MAQIRVENLRKQFGGFAAVKDSTFTIDNGTFFVMLGPSGCGKTTTLRMIAGLELPSDGRILLDGEEVTFQRASQRDIAFVFQMFALYPHLNVRRNIAYPLRSQGVSRAETRQRVDETARLLRIEHLLSRSVSGLSGGDRQRVALGRAIVRRPKAFLMDEPLGALDALTREQVQELILDVWDRTGKMVFFITHSVEEALFLATRLVVMKPRPGEIEKVYDLDFARRYIACRDARKVKSDPEFIRMREVVLSDIQRREAANAAVAGD